MRSARQRRNWSELVVVANWTYSHQDNHAFRRLMDRLLREVGMGDTMAEPDSQGSPTPSPKGKEEFYK